jgi:hypothetical protein
VHRSDRKESSRRFALPSPALVVASLALFVALAGVGWAAVVLPANSVGSAQVKNGSLLAADLAPAARRALAGRVGPQGPKGDPGLSGFEIVETSSSYTSSPDRTLTVDCPAGKRLVGGGAGVWGRAMIWIPKGVAVTASHPHDEDTWLAAAQEVVPTDDEWFLHITAICAATT